jgi:Flp pilus assembly protein TadD
VVSGFDAGKKAIDGRKFRRAISLFVKVVESEAKNADAHNYLGFAYRNTGNLKLAAVSYRRALAINPRHQGALEYQGEMFLILNRIDDARANLGRLKKACPFGCEELTDLKHDIAEYVAARIAKSAS